MHQQGDHAECQAAWQRDQAEANRVVGEEEGDERQQR